MEARSSGDLVLARSISMIESNGFGSNGVNPVANLDVLTKPSEPHLRKWPGMAGSCCFWRFALFREWVLELRFIVWVRSVDNEEVLASLDGMRCIVKTISFAIEQSGELLRAVVTCISKKTWFGFSGSLRNFIEQL
jgi:hypothetical protein